MQRPFKICRHSWSSPPQISPIRLTLVVGSYDLFLFLGSAGLFIYIIYLVRRDTLTSPFLQRTAVRYFPFACYNPAIRQPWMDGSTPRDVLYFSISLSLLCSSAKPSLSCMIVSPLLVFTDLAPPTSINSDKPRSVKELTVTDPLSAELLPFCACYL